MAGWFPLGNVVLVVLGVAVYFGLVHGVLDRMRLTDRTALLAIAAIIIGSFVTIPIIRGPNELTINVGGAIVPLIIAGYLIVTADTLGEKTRALTAALISGVAVYAVGKVIPADEPGTGFIDPLYIHALFAGTVGYLAGRSRRAAFVAGSVGTVLADIAHYFEVTAAGLTRTRTALGGAGAFDATVVAAVLAVALAELVGETREYLGGGPRSDRVKLPEVLRHDDAEAGPSATAGRVDGRSDGRRQTGGRGGSDEAR